MSPKKFLLETAWHKYRCPVCNEILVQSRAGFYYCDTVKSGHSLTLIITKEYREESSTATPAHVPHDEGDEAP